MAHYGFYNSYSMQSFSALTGLALGIADISKLHRLRRSMEATLTGKVY
jgi:hypothetical protein